MKNLLFYLLLLSSLSATAGYEYTYNVFMGEFTKSSTEIVVSTTSSYNSFDPTFVSNYYLSTPNNFFINSTGADDASSIGLILGPTEFAANIVVSYKLNITSSPNVAVGLPQVNFMSPGSAFSSYSIEVANALSSTPVGYNSFFPASGVWDSVLYNTSTTESAQSGLQVGDSISVIYNFYHELGTTDTIFLDNFRIEANSIESFDIYDGKISAKRKSDGIVLSTFLEGPMDIKITRTSDWSGEKAVIYDGPAEQNFQITDVEYLLPGDYTYSLYGKEEQDELLLDMAKISIDSRDKVIISPNPFTELIKVESIRPDFVYVINSSGQLVHSQEISTGTNEIDLGYLSPGAYYLKTRSSTTPITKK